MENLKSKGLVEGSILSVIILFLMFMINMPEVSVLGYLLVPIPVAILYIKYKWKISLLSVIVSFILVSIALGPIRGLTAGIIALFIGHALGIGAKSKKSGTYTLVYIFIGNIISIVTTTAIWIYISFNMTFNSFLQNIVTQYKVAAEQILKTQPTPEMQESVKSMISAMTVQNLQKGIPVFLVVLTLISSFVIFIIARNILLRLNLRCNSLTPFTKWYINPLYIAILVGIALVGMELNKNGIQIGMQIFNSTLGILAMLFGLQTISFIGYFASEKLKLAKGFVVVIILFLIISGIIIYIFPIGLVDVLFDYRSIDKDSLGSIIRRKLDPKQ